MEDNVTTSPQVTSCLTPREERWWVWLVASTVIYLVGLSVSALAYLIHWSYRKRCRRQTHTMQHDTVTYVSSISVRLDFRYYISPHHWRESAQTLMSGSTIPSKILIAFIGCCNVCYMVLVVYHSYQFIEECFSLSD